MNGKGSIGRYEGKNMINGIFDKKILKKMHVFVCLEERIALEFYRKGSISQRKNAVWNSWLRHEKWDSIFSWFKLG